MTGIHKNRTGRRRRDGASSASNAASFDAHANGGGAAMYPSKNIIQKRRQFDGPHHAGCRRE